MIQSAEGIRPRLLYMLRTSAKRQRCGKFLIRGNVAVMMSSKVKTRSIGVCKGYGLEGGLIIYKGLAGS